MAARASNCRGPIYGSTELLLFEQPLEARTVDDALWAKDKPLIRRDDRTFAVLADSLDRDRCTRTDSSDRGLP
jgi:hypothetical protein